MRVAALYDIHANLPALEAVLREVRNTEVDHVLVGGDVVPGPMPRETLELLLGLDTPMHFICAMESWLCWHRSSRVTPTQRRTGAPHPASHSRNRNGRYCAGPRASCPLSTLRYLNDGPRCMSSRSAG